LDGRDEVTALAWKKIPPEADYFHCEPGAEYYICEEGFVIEGRYLQEESVNLEKAIWPTVQGNRAYIRVRRKGMDKKFQLVRMYIELFPDLLGHEVQVQTRKGPFALCIEADSREVAPPVRTPAPKVRKEKVPRPVREQPEPLVAEGEGGPPFDEDEDEDAVIATDVRLCKVCNLRKRVSEFSPRDDMCMDCYMGRDELLKEIIARRRRKTKPAAPKVMEENVDGNSNVDDGLDSFGRMDFGISLPE
jgi:hypothetical protein